MNSLLDTELQFDILMRLYECRTFDAVSIYSIAGVGHTFFIAKINFNLLQMESRGLVETVRNTMNPEQVVSARITAAGVGFVQGELHSGNHVLEPACVRVPASVMREVLHRSIMQSALMAYEKKCLDEALTALSPRELSELAVELLNRSIGSVTDIWDIIMPRALAGPR